MTLFSFKMDPLELGVVVVAILLIVYSVRRIRVKKHR